MRVSAAKASVFFSVALPAVTRGTPILGSNAIITRGDYMLLRQENGGVYAQFQASCAGCSLDGENVWPVDLFIGGTRGLCENITVSVNGQELSHRWEGQLGSGSGRILSNSSNGSVELQATWQDICVTAPLGAPHKENAHIFTLTLDNDHGHGLESDVGFTISFGGYNEIEILRVSNVPVDLSDGSEWEGWRHAETGIESNTDPKLDSWDLPLDMKLEAELQKLQVLHYELRQLQESVTLQEKKIRHLLKRDCKPLLTQWQACEDFFCYLKSSWQKVPEFYWSIRYRFGLLGSERVNPICSPAPIQLSNNTSPSPARSSHAVPTPSKYQFPTYSGSISLPPSVSTVSPLVTTPYLPPHITPSAQNTDITSDSNTRHLDESSTAILLPIYSPTKHFIRSCAIVLLVVLIFGLFYRVVRHSTAFRRRRRDIASRREEFRTRRAYRNAARRLRWRQWWERQFYIQPQGASSSHSLAEFQQARGTNPGDGNGSTGSSYGNNDSESESSSLSENQNEEPESRMMQAEILGLRRVLEYVGELVGSDGPSSTRRRTRSRSRSGPPPYAAAISSNSNRNRSAGAIRDSNSDNDSEMQSSSMQRMSTGLASSRASTMFSLETGSLVTLETIDTLESGSAPPSYHP